MVITEAAKNRLIRLLPAGCKGFRYEGHIGTCRGSTPILKPVQEIATDEEIVEASGISFFTKKEHFERLCSCAIDYDPSFFGKGLNMTWHRDGCVCSH